jgi:transposase
MQHRKSRPDSFKKDAVRRLMARGSKTITEIAQELGVSPSMLHRWRERFEPELTGDGAQPIQRDREEVERLRRELRDLQAENTLLKKAAALFAKEVK